MLRPLGPAPMPPTKRQRSALYAEPFVLYVCLNTETDTEPAYYMQDFREVPDRIASVI